MKKLEDNNLIKRLEEGKKTTVMLMTHNSYWSQLEKFKSKYSNLEVSAFGRSTGYARMRKNDIPTDCDFIILDGLDFYKTAEFCEAIKMAMKMSKENNKRVSMGYVYFIPNEKRLNPNMCNEIKIASFKNDDCYIDTILIPSNYNLLTLADMIIETHNELEKQMVLHKIKEEDSNN